MKSRGIRVKHDDRTEKIGKKIRDSEVMKTPYMLIIGEKEINDNKVAVRIHGQGDVGAYDVEDFVNSISKRISDRDLNFDL